jgi:hypothetical protein
MWTPRSDPVHRRASLSARLGQEKSHEPHAPHSRTDHPRPSGSGRATEPGSDRCRCLPNSGGVGGDQFPQAKARWRHERHGREATIEFEEENSKLWPGASPKKQRLLADALLDMAMLRKLVVGISEVGTPLQCGLSSTLPIPVICVACLLADRLEPHLATPAPADGAR